MDDALGLPVLEKGLLEGVAPKEREEVGVCDGVGVGVDDALREDVSDGMVDDVSTERDDSVAIAETIACWVKEDVFEILADAEDEEVLKDDKLDRSETRDNLLADTDDDWL